MKVNEPFHLDNPNIVWLVESGKLALFAIKIQHGSNNGQRRYLCSVSTGEALFGQVLLAETITPRQWIFEAVAVEPAQLAQLSMNDLLQRIHAGDDAAITLVEKWVYHLSQVVRQQQTLLVMPLNLNQTTDEQSFSLKAGEELQLRQKTLCWVKLQQGITQWLGIEEFKFTPDSPAFPLTSATWLEAKNSVTGVMLLTRELEQAELLAGLTNLHNYFFAYLNLLLTQEAETESRKLQEREQFNRQVIAGALGELAGVLQPPQEAVFFQQGPPALVAMGAIGKYLGITIRPPIADDLNHIKDPVAAIARASQIRIRRIKLTNDWWHQEHEPLLAFSQWENCPVALLPSNQGYVLFDPVTQTRTPLNESIAQTLTQKAYILYRPLPQVINNATDLLRFAIKGNGKNITGILLLGIIGTFLGMIAPQATAILINYAIPSSDRSLIWQIGLILFAVAIAQLAFQIAQSILVLRVESLTNNELQPAIWDRLLRLRPEFFRQYASGDLVNRVMTVSNIQERLSGVTQRSFLSGIFALFNLVLMFIYSWQLAFVGVGLGLISCIFTATASFFLIQKIRQQQKLDGTINALAIQLINGVTKLRVAMAEERAFAAWAKKYSQRTRLKASGQQISDIVSIFNEALPLISSALLFWLVISTKQTSLNIGTFIAFNYALSIFIKGATDLSNTITDIWSIVPLWERSQPIFQSLPESDEHKEPPGQLTGCIEINQVSFRYLENAPLVLNDVSIYANPGEFIALVGPSGSGKSTIFRLLLGFETPTQGNIYYDGKDLSRLDIPALRRSLGVVLQNGKISSGSIFDNITAGALINLEAAWEAAQMAGLAEDIDQMPMGMHTVISEGGSNLSGGQKQRLLIARSLVSKPKIILMDEATSALDNRTQAIISKSLEQLQATRVVIAHRLSTIRNADRIYVIDSGRVVQVGTFSELIAQEGLFARLAARQL